MSKEEEPTYLKKEEIEYFVSLLDAKPIIFKNGKYEQKSNRK